MTQHLTAGCFFQNFFQLTGCHFAAQQRLNAGGEIRRGLRADLIVVDHKVNVKQVFLGGKEQTFTEAE